MCEIDKQVVEVSKKYLASSTAVAFEDPRVELVILQGSHHQLFMDAALFVKEQENSFDVIIVDSSDPVGMRLPDVFDQVLLRACTPTHSTTQ